MYDRYIYRNTSSVIGPFYPELRGSDDHIRKEFHNLKINSYQIGMDSAGTYRSAQTRKFGISFTRENGLNDWLSRNSFSDMIGGSAGYMPKDGSEEETADNGQKKTTPMDRYDSMYTGPGSRISEVKHNDELRSIDRIRDRFVLYLWRMFFGQKRSDELADKLGIDRLDSLTDDIKPAQGTPFSVIRIEGVQETCFCESQEMTFAAAGNVTTEDGRSIDFNLDIAMSSSFTHYYREEVTGVAAMCDPLVLNFTGEIAGLTDTKFFFDLDCDGVEEEISNLTSGNGFLALDENSDGIINDGSELFGTKTGDGFGDLARFDSDGNGWIDENDDIYDKLKIWIKDAQGNDTLYSLKDKNVGAIYLGNADTSFGLRSNTTGNLNGAIRKTGVFLYEDGTGVGAISHLDIAN